MDTLTDRLVKSLNTLDGIKGLNKAFLELAYNSDKKVKIIFDNQTYTVSFIKTSKKRKTK
jgi:hypothetical protein